MTNILEFKRVTTNLLFYSSILFLEKSLASFKNDTQFRHMKKLENIYGSEIISKDEIEIVINLSNYLCNENELSILNKGLNFGLKKPITKINKKIEVEKLYNTI